MFQKYCGIDNNCGNFGYKLWNDDNNEVMWNVHTVIALGCVCVCVDLFVWVLQLWWTWECSDALIGSARGGRSVWRPFLFPSSITSCVCPWSLTSCAMSWKVKGRPAHLPPDGQSVAERSCVHRDTPAPHVMLCAQQWWPPGVGSRFQLKETSDGFLISSTPSSSSYPASLAPRWRCRSDTLTWRPSSSPCWRPTELTLLPPPPLLRSSINRRCCRMRPSVRRWERHCGSCRGFWSSCCSSYSCSSPAPSSPSSLS